MQFRQLIRGVVIAVIVIALVDIPLAGRAEGPIEIHAIQSLTGAIAFVGKEGATGLGVLQDTINRAGGIRGRAIKFVIHDDESSPQIDVQIANDLLAKGVKVVIGPDPVAGCNAIAPLIKGKLVLYCVSAAFHPPAHSYGFSAGVSTTEQMIFAARYARARGLKKFASITSIDSNGQDADRALSLVMKMPENKDLQLVDAEHFNLSDLTVAAQMSRIKASGAQVLYTGNNGTPLGVILHGYTDLGLDIPLITSSGALNVATVTQYAAILPKEFLIAGVLSDGPAVIPNSPEKTAVRYYTAAMKAAGYAPDHALNLTWDPGLIVIDALRTYGANATAAQINSYIEHLHSWAGTAGRYDFSNGNQSGLNANSLVMVRWSPESKAWVAVSRPGGGKL